MEQRRMGRIQEGREEDKAPRIRKAKNDSKRKMLKAKEERPHSVHHVKINVDEPKRNSSKILLAHLPQHLQMPGGIKEILLAEKGWCLLRES